MAAYACDPGGGAMYYHYNPDGGPASFDADVRHRRRSSNAVYNNGYLAPHAAGTYAYRPVAASAIEATRRPVVVASARVPARAVHEQRANAGDDQCQLCCCSLWMLVAAFAAFAATSATIANTLGVDLRLPEPLNRSQAEIERLLSMAMVACVLLLGCGTREINCGCHQSNDYDDCDYPTCSLGGSKNRRLFQIMFHALMGVAAVANLFALFITTLGQVTSDNELEPAQQPDGGDESDDATSSITNMRIGVFLFALLCMEASGYGCVYGSSCTGEQEDKSRCGGLSVRQLVFASVLAPMAALLSLHANPYCRIVGFFVWVAIGVKTVIETFACGGKTTTPENDSIQLYLCNDNCKCSCPRPCECTEDRADCRAASTRLLIQIGVIVAMAAASLVVMWPLLTDQAWDKFVVGGAAAAVNADAMVVAAMGVTQLFVACFVLRCQYSAYKIAETHDAEQNSQNGATNNAILKYSGLLVTFVACLVAFAVHVYIVLGFSLPLGCSDESSPPCFARDPTSAIYWISFSMYLTNHVLSFGFGDANKLYMVCWRSATAFMLAAVTSLFVGGSLVSWVTTMSLTTMFIVPVLCVTWLVNVADVLTNKSDNEPNEHKCCSWISSWISDPAFAGLSALLVATTWTVEAALTDFEEGPYIVGALLAWALGFYFLWKYNKNNQQEENTGEENAGEENAGEENAGEENNGGGFISNEVFNILYFIVAVAMTLISAVKFVGQFATAYGDQNPDTDPLYSLLWLIGMILSRLAMFGSASKSENRWVIRVEAVVDTLMFVGSIGAFNCCMYFAKPHEQPDEGSTLSPHGFIVDDNTVVVMVFLVSCFVGSSLLMVSLHKTYKRGSVFGDKWKQSMLGIASALYFVNAASTFARMCMAMGSATDAFGESWSYLLLLGIVVWISYAGAILALLRGFSETLNEGKARARVCETIALLQSLAGLVAACVITVFRLDWPPLDVLVVFHVFAVAGPLVVAFVMTFLGDYGPASTPIVFLRGASVLALGAASVGLPVVLAGLSGFEHSFERAMPWLLYSMIAFGFTAAFAFKEDQHAGKSPNAKMSAPRKFYLGLLVGLPVVVAVTSCCLTLYFYSAETPLTFLAWNAPMVTAWFVLAGVAGVFQARMPDMNATTSSAVCFITLLLPMLLEVALAGWLGTDQLIDSEVWHNSEISRFYSIWIVMKVVALVGATGWLCAWKVLLEKSLKKKQESASTARKGSVAGGEHSHLLMSAPPTTTAHYMYYPWQQPAMTQAPHLLQGGPVDQTATDESKAKNDDGARSFLQNVACAFVVIRLSHIAWSLAMLLAEWRDDLGVSNGESRDAEYEPAFLWLVPTVMSLVSICAVVSAGFKAPCTSNCSPWLERYAGCHRFFYLHVFGITGVAISLLGTGAVLYTYYARIGGETPTLEAFETSWYACMLIGGMALCAWGMFSEPLVKEQVFREMLAERTLALRDIFQPLRQEIEKAMPRGESAQHLPSAPHGPLQGNVRPPFTQELPSYKEAMELRNFIDDLPSYEAATGVVPPSYKTVVGDLYIIQERSENQTLNEAAKNSRDKLDKLRKNYFAEGCPFFRSWRFILFIVALVLVGCAIASTPFVAVLIAEIASSARTTADAIVERGNSTSAPASDVTDESAAGNMFAWVLSITNVVFSGVYAVALFGYGRFKQKTRLLFMFLGAIGLVGSIALFALSVTSLVNSGAAMPSTLTERPWFFPVASFASYCGGLVALFCALVSWPWVNTKSKDDTKGLKNFIYACAVTLPFLGTVTTSTVFAWRAQGAPGDDSSPEPLHGGSGDDTTLWQCVAMVVACSVITAVWLSLEKAKALWLSREVGEGSNQNRFYAHLTEAIRGSIFAMWIALFVVFVLSAENADGVLSSAVPHILVVYALRLAVVPRYVFSADDNQRTPTAFAVLFTLGQPASTLIYALVHALGFVARVAEVGAEAGAEAGAGAEAEVLEWWILASVAFADFMVFMSWFASKARDHQSARQTGQGSVEGTELETMLTENGGDKRHLLNSGFTQHRLGPNMTALFYAPSPIQQAHNVGHGPMYTASHMPTHHVGHRPMYTASHMPTHNVGHRPMYTASHMPTHNVDNGQNSNLEYGQTSNGFDSYSALTRATTHKIHALGGGRGGDEYAHYLAVTLWYTVVACVWVAGLFELAYFWFDESLACRLTRLALFTVANLVVFAFASKLESEQGHGFEPNVGATLLVASMVHTVVYLIGLFFEHVRVGLDTYDISEHSTDLHEHDAWLGVVVWLLAGVVLSPPLGMIRDDKDQFRVCKCRVRRVRATLANIVFHASPLFIYAVSVLCCVRAFLTGTPALHFAHIIGCFVCLAYTEVLYFKRDDAFPYQVAYFVCTWASACFTVVWTIIRFARSDMQLAVPLQALSFALLFVHYLVGMGLGQRIKTKSAAQWKPWQRFMNVAVVGSMFLLHGAAFAVGNYRYYKHPKSDEGVGTGDANSEKASAGADPNLEWFLLVLHPLLLVFVEFHNVVLKDVFDIASSRVPLRQRSDRPTEDEIGDTSSLKLYKHVASFLMAEVQVMVLAGGAMCVYLRLVMPRGFENGNDAAVIGEIVFSFIMGLHAILPTLKTEKKTQAHYSWLAPLFALASVIFLVFIAGSSMVDLALHETYAHYASIFVPIWMLFFFAVLPAERDTDVKEQKLWWECDLTILHWPVWILLVLTWVVSHALIFFVHEELRYVALVGVLLSEVSMIAVELLSWNVQGKDSETITAHKCYAHLAFVLPILNFLVATFALTGGAALKEVNYEWLASFVISPLLVLGELLVLALRKEENVEEINQNRKPKRINHKIYAWLTEAVCFCALLCALAVTFMLISGGKPDTGGEPDTSGEPDTDGSLKAHEKDVLVWWFIAAFASVVAVASAVASAFTSRNVSTPSKYILHAISVADLVYAAVLLFGAASLHSTTWYVAYEVTAVILAVIWVSLAMANGKLGPGKCMGIFQTSALLAMCAAQVVVTVYSWSHVDTIYTISQIIGAIAGVAIAIALLKNMYNVWNMLCGKRCLGHVAFVVALALGGFWLWVLQRATVSYKSEENAGGVLSTIAPFIVLFAVSVLPAFKEPAFCCAERDIFKNAGESCGTCWNECLGEWKRNNPECKCCVECCLCPMTCGLWLLIREVNGDNCRSCMGKVCDRPSVNWFLLPLAASVAMWCIMPQRQLGVLVVTVVALGVWLLTRAISCCCNVEEQGHRVPTRATATGRQYDDSSQLLFFY